MNRHELEARLVAVREEIALIEQQAGVASEEIKKSTEESKERMERMLVREKAIREARTRQQSTFWGRTKSSFGFDEKLDLPKDYGRGDGLSSLFDGLKLAVIAPLTVEAKRRFDELRLEEARLLDQLEPLQPKSEPTKAEKREKIYTEMASRRAEWDRVRERETDQEQLRRLKNMFDDANAKDEDRLRNLL